METLYIDIPSEYEYDWSLGSRAEEVLQELFKLPVKFICNSDGKISTGDCYELRFNTLEDKLIFVLSNEFKIVNKNIVEQYKDERKRKYPHNWK